MTNTKSAAKWLGWGEPLCLGAVDQSCSSGLRFNRIGCEELNDDLVSLASVRAQYVAAAAAEGMAHKSRKIATVNYHV